MLGKELKKIGIYTIFLAILLVPMLGFPKPEFQAERPFIVLAVLVGLLILNLVMKFVRKDKDKTVAGPGPGGDPGPALEPLSPLVDPGRLDPGGRNLPPAGQQLHDRRGHHLPHLRLPGDGG